MHSDNDRGTNGQPLTNLDRICQVVANRVERIASNHAFWPCRRGCDDCCRSLASVPRVSQPEWRCIAKAIDEMPAAVGCELRQRIRDSAFASRPVTCPLLEASTGSCLIYDARPIACRSYGFYAERDKVLGCDCIVTISQQKPDVIWGNHPALEEQMDDLGPAAELFIWLARTRGA